MIRINLLPVREERRKANLRQQGIFLGVALVSGVLVCGVLHTAIVAQLASQRARVVEAKAELAELEEILKEVDRFRQEKEDIEQKLSVIARLEESRRGPVRIMDEIATRIPDRMWLKSMRLEGARLELQGYSIDNEVIAAFLTSLEESKFLTNVELKGSKLTERKGLNLNEFQIECSDAMALTAQRNEQREQGGDVGRARSRRARR